MEHCNWLKWCEERWAKKAISFMYANLCACATEKCVVCSVYTVHMSVNLFTPLFSCIDAKSIQRFKIETRMRDKKRRKTQHRQHLENICSSGTKITICNVWYKKRTLDCITWFFHLATLPHYNDDNDNKLGVPLNSCQINLRAIPMGHFALHRLHIVGISSHTAICNVCT